MKRSILLSLGTAAIAVGLCALDAKVAPPGDPPLTGAKAIRHEALLPNGKATVRPLPLAAHWNTGELPRGFDPAYQMRMIAQKHHLLPWFRLPDVNCSDSDPRWIRYYEAPIKRAAALKLPISFISTQWERLLSDQKAFLELPPDENPNVVETGGKIRPEVSPLGPVAPWREVGKMWASSPMLRKLQEWYPDPPLVLMVSNNEHAKLSWMKVHEDRRYLERYGPGRDEEFRRKVVAEGWIERYRALHQGMRDGFHQSAWQKNALFVGYEAFGPRHLGRWNGWKEYSLYVTGRIDPSPLTWQGGSPSFYVFNWSDGMDYMVQSPQVEAMNWVFMQEEAFQLHPGFWFEISTWDGHEPAEKNDKWKTYARLGQTFNPERYGGMVQFGMWLLRPRVVREFRHWNETLAIGEPYFLPIVQAVDRVHANSTLRHFWRKGQLVANRAHPHPYQVFIPREYQDRDRWFLLDTDADPARPWSLSTELPVFSLALVLGQAPNRKWLVYAHAPRGARTDVTLTLPEYGPLTVDVSVAGSFYLVHEKDNSVRTLRL
jgi:hypothetical protein